MIRIRVLQEAHKLVVGALQHLFYLIENQLYAKRFLIWIEKLN